MSVIYESWNALFFVESHSEFTQQETKILVGKQIGILGLILDHNFAIFQSSKKSVHYNNLLLQSYELLIFFLTQNLLYLIHRLH